MEKLTKNAVIIPVYKVAKHISEVIESMPEFINYIIVVDDKCPQKSGEVADKLLNPKVIVIYHEKNLGVGGAVITGYRKALELGADIMIKMDGDGQMNPAFLWDLITPLMENMADYTKANRFKDFMAIRSMPWIRLFGNSILSFFIKISSGYWDIMDPTNGFTAINKAILEEINLSKISKRYFFESDMLINLNIENAVVKDIAIPTKYGNEESSLSITYVLMQFPFKLVAGFIKRVFFKYYLFDFNMASVYLIIGLPMFLFGITLGAVEWIKSLSTGIARPVGTIMLIVLPIILSFQMLLEVIHIDIKSIPRKN
jgi:glycosyltransferase involved in cell wall biosynthesis